MTVERFKTHVHAIMPCEITSLTECRTTIRPQALVWSQFLMHIIDVACDVTLLLGFKITLVVRTRKPLRSLIMDVVDVLLDTSLPIGPIITCFVGT